jgi:hypothetical protein
MVAPTILYRVEDEHSRARYVEEEGIRAENKKTRVDFRHPSWELCKQLKNHINWSNRDATVLISTYSNKNVAIREAKRRVKGGKKEVVVYKINSRKKKGAPMEYRELQPLMRKLKLEIPECARNNSKYEYVVLYNVPDSAVQIYKEYSATFETFVDLL